MNGILPSIDALKSQAKALRKTLGQDGQAISHGHALELVAKTHGYRDWNTAHAAAGNAPRVPVVLGQRIKGRYLGQPFEAEVIGVQTLSAGRYQIVFVFDQPIDVVTFDSFSAFRSRITKVVDSRGRSFEKTSNGVPHVVLDL